MNYTQLLQIIQDFAVDAEASFVSHIPDFVRAAEKRIYNDAELPLARSTTTVNTVIGDNLIAVPADFRNMDSLAVTVTGEKRFLLVKTTDFLDTAYPFSTTGTPRFYAIKDEATVQLAPVPVDIIPVEINYMGYPPSIVTTSTSWLGDNYEYALQYGALRDAAVYLKEEADVIAMYDARYAEAIGQIKAFASPKSRIDRYRRR